MGGSSGGSGGSSGAVSYPDYMEAQHSSWLSAVASQITTVVTGGSPYATALAYDPDCALNASNYIISQFNDQVVALDPEVDWASAYDVADGKHSFTDFFSTAATATTVSTFQSDLEARRDADFKPAYKVGMLNVNAVMSSSFVLGDALITAEVARNVAKFSADLTFKNQDRQANYVLGQEQIIANSTGKIVEMITNEITFYQAVAHLTTDANRIKIVAKTEELAANYEYDRKDALWDLEAYKHGGNMLASIAGAAAGSDNSISTGKSVLGGALSGAAAGASIGGPVGAGIGAIAGGLAGLLG